MESGYGITSEHVGTCLVKLNQDLVIVKLGSLLSALRWMSNDEMSEILRKKLFIV